VKLVNYQIGISGLKVKEGTIPLTALKDISDVILNSSEKVLRLFFEGTSSKRGKYPEWLKKSLDFTITGIRKGSTILELEVPTLKETIPFYFQQKKLWKDKIQQDDTAISLCSKSFNDITLENFGSDLYDAGVLKSFQKFRNIVKNYAKELVIRSDTKTADNFKISKEVIEKIDKIKIQIPEPRITVISGFFNMIEHSHRQFQLNIIDDETINGELDPKYIELEDMRQLWGKRVTIKGEANFKPSGKIHFLNAHVVRAFEKGDEILEKVPVIQKSFKFAEDLMKKKNAGSVLKKIWGKWPGDESIDEILRQLHH
jgi:hypothetical protein